MQNRRKIFGGRRAYGSFSFLVIWNSFLAQKDKLGGDINPERWIHLILSAGEKKEKTHFRASFCLSFVSEKELGKMPDFLYFFLNIAFILLIIFDFLIL